MVNAAMVLQISDCKHQLTVLQVVGKLIALQMPVALLCIQLQSEGMVGCT
jgi:hypothetical protein